jgi:Phage capsid family
MLKAKAAGSGERLDSDGAFGTPPTQMWSLPLIQSPVVARGTALVGDWSQGATLWVREGVLVRSSDSDQDDFLKNRITLLGEGRYALTVERPVCFAEVHLAA